MVPFNIPQSSSSLLVVVVAAIVFVIDGPAVCEATLITAPDNNKKNLRINDGRNLGADESEDFESVSSVPQNDPSYNSEDYLQTEKSKGVVIVSPSNSTAAANTEAEYGFACQTIRKYHVVNTCLYITLCYMGSIVFVIVFWVQFFLLYVVHLSNLIARPLLLLLYSNNENT